MTNAPVAALPSLLLVAACSVGPASDDGAARASVDALDESTGGESFSAAIGSGTKPGLVTGRIYDDLAKNVDARMNDFEALGVRVLRIEIERATPMSTYARIVRAAKKRGIEVLAVVTQNSLEGVRDPMAGTREEFDATFVPKVVAAIDRTTSELPDISRHLYRHRATAPGWHPDLFFPPIWLPRRRLGGDPGNLKNGPRMPARRYRYLCLLSAAGYKIL
jgi:hypothetical protein